jgi:hypothetical protein
VCVKQLQFDGLVIPQAALPQLLEKGDRFAAVYGCVGCIVAHAGKGLASQKGDRLLLLSEVILLVLQACDMPANGMFCGVDVCEQTRACLQLSSSATA